MSTNEGVKYMTPGGWADLPTDVAKRLLETPGAIRPVRGRDGQTKLIAPPPLGPEIIDGWDLP